MLLVAAGDVVEILVNFQEGAVMSYEQYGCWFIPPKYVNPPTPIAVEGGDYSLDEQPVMISDKTLKFFTVTDLVRDGITNCAYQFWVQYTKIAD
jgi:hypothetical protein